MRKQRNKERVWVVEAVVFMLVDGSDTVRDILCLLST